MLNLPLSGRRMLNLLLSGRQTLNDHAA